MSKTNERVKTAKKDLEELTVLQQQLELLLAKITQDAAIRERLMKALLRRFSPQAPVAPPLKIPESIREVNFGRVFDMETLGSASTRSMHTAKR